MCECNRTGERVSGQRGNKHLLYEEMILSLITQLLCIMAL